MIQNPHARYKTYRDHTPETLSSNKCKESHNSSHIIIQNEHFHIFFNFFYIYPYFIIINKDIVIYLKTFILFSFTLFSNQLISTIIFIIIQIPY